MSDIENDENANLIDDAEEATIGMSEIEGFDFERAVQLMSAIEKCATVGVKATSIAGLAQAALNEMNEKAKAIAKRRAAEFAKVEAAAAAKAAAERRAKEEADAEAAAEAKAAADAKVRVPRAIPTRAPAPTPTESNGRRL